MRSDVYILHKKRFGRHIVIIHKVLATSVGELGCRSPAAARVSSHFYLSCYILNCEINSILKLLNNHETVSDESFYNKYEINTE